MIETEKKENALLVLVDLEGEEGHWPTKEQSEEFKNLALSTGILVSDLIVVRRKEINPALYIGKGKVAEIALVVEEDGIDVVIFNNDLNYTQQRNLEDVIKVKTIDRTQLILDIFSAHANTREGALQVELAQLEYLLPKLRGKGITLSRLGGGIGTRGPGEKKLEVERRRIDDKISHIKKGLDDVLKHRVVQRQKRNKEHLSMCSFVGYTSAGKSTLINALTGTDQKTSDSLFTTLDPVTRIFTSKSLKVVFSDTVGFIQKLPPKLVVSFKATLEELKFADVLLHVVDASSSNFKRLIVAVDLILKELKLESKPTILVFNKIDRLEKSELEGLKSLYPDAVFISALKKINLEAFLDKINAIFALVSKELVVKIPFDSLEVMDYLYKNSEVTKVEYTESLAIAWVKIKTDLIPYLEKKNIKMTEI